MTVDMTAPPEPKLFRLLYRSQCTLVGSQELIDVEIERILLKSRQANARAGVTGALMFASSFFFQVLEGRSDELEKTFERICRDLRHAEIQLLEFSTLPQRAFADWSMTRVDPDTRIEALFGQLQASYATLAEATGTALTRMSAAAQAMPAATRVEHLP